MKLLKSNKGFGGGAVAMAIGVITVLILAIILGSVENSLVWTQTLSGTVGNYVEPLALLSAFALVGYMAYTSIKN